jgi:hypothetical protein
MSPPGRSQEHWALSPAASEENISCPVTWVFAERLTGARQYKTVFP